MQNRKYFPFFIFALGTSAELGTAIFNWPGQHLIFKPLIVAGLIGHYWVMSRSRSIIFLLALVFCWVGDVLLIFQSKENFFFVSGLASFLVAHVAYIFCYRHWQVGSASAALLGSQKVRFSFPILLLGTGFITILFPSLGGLKVPMMMYTLIITLMVLTAFFRYGQTSTSSFWFIFSGAFLFTISDATLAINKFKIAFGAAPFIIMFTYSVAQYFIVEGALRHERVSKEKLQKK